MKSLLSVFTIAFLLFSSPSFAVDTRLLLVGGGNRPEAAMKKFAEWAGGQNAKVMIIGWQSEIPEDYFDGISTELRKEGVTEFIPALRVPQNEVEFARFSKDLEQATAIFWTGGSQNRGMAGVIKWGLADLMLQKFKAGLPMAGTSAGTAISSNPMLTGNGSETVPGLGFLDVTVDMHFQRSGRLARLEGAIAQSGSRFGIGIMENGSVTVINSKDVEVLGFEHIFFFQHVSSGFLVDELSPLEKFDLTTWKQTVRISRSEQTNTNLSFGCKSVFEGVLELPFTITSN